MVSRRKMCCIAFLCALMWVGQSAQAGVHPSTKSKLAKRLIDEAKVLIGIDDGEASKLLRKAMRLLPRSHRNSRRARRYLRRMQPEPKPRNRPSTPTKQRQWVNPCEPFRIVGKLLSTGSITQVERLCLTLPEGTRRPTTLWQRWGHRFLNLSWYMLRSHRSRWLQQALKRRIKAAACAFEVPAPSRLLMCSYERHICLSQKISVCR